MDRLKELIPLESHHKQETILNAASYIPSMIVGNSCLDTNPMLLNCGNGTLDLSTGILREHSPDDYITRIVSIDFDPGAECPVFIQFLRKIFTDDDELMCYLQRFIGYCLTGRTDEQVLLFLYGTGANGKTTLANIIGALLGDFAATAGGDLLLQRNGGDLNTLVALAALRGTRLVKISELDDGERIAEARVKSLTGGDVISCRFLHQGFFEYRPAFKVLLLGNYKPTIRGTDHGIWRRIHLLPFKVTISDSEKDPGLYQKLMNELPGILAWAVRGCMAWQKHGLHPPKVVLEEVNAYRKDEDAFRLSFAYLRRIAHLNTVESKPMYLLTVLGWSPRSLRVVRQERQVS
jgi:putative DNA primase/helicase